MQTQMVAAVRFWETQVSDIKNIFVDKVYARKVLNDMKIPKKEQDLFLEKCREFGGYCDCEVLMNAAEILLGEETPW